MNLAALPLEVNASIRQPEITLRTAGYPFTEKLEL